MVTSMGKYIMWLSVEPSLLHGWKLSDALLAEA